MNYVIVHDHLLLRGRDVAQNNNYSVFVAVSIYDTAYFALVYWIHFNKFFKMKANYYWDVYYYLFQRLFNLNKPIIFGRLSIKEVLTI